MARGAPGPGPVGWRHGKPPGKKHLEGKKVILWSARDALAQSYKRFLGEDGLSLQWLDDLVFGEDALTSGTWKPIELD